MVANRKIDTIYFRPMETLSDDEKVFIFLSLFYIVPRKIEPTQLIFRYKKKKRQNLTNILIKWKLLVDFWRMFYACMSFSDGAKFPLPSKQKVSNIHSFGECFETVFNRHIETVHGQQILHAP